MLRLRNVTSPLFVGVGPVLVDQFVHCDVLPEDEDLPLPGTKMRAENADHMRRVRKRWVEGWSPQTQVGGPVLVALRQARALGAIIRFVGAISDDEMGTIIRDQLRHDGFPAQSLVIEPGGHSGSAIVWIDRNGDRSILFDSGSVDRLKPFDIEPLTTVAPAVIHIDSREPEAASALAKWGLDQGAVVHYDVDPWESVTSDLLALASVAQVSCREIENTDMGSDTVAGIARSFQKRYSLGLAIVTNGEKGLFAVTSEGNEYNVAAFPVGSVDSVGAGDVFAGSYEMARWRGESIANALRFASATGAIHTTRLGNSLLAGEAEISKLMDASNLP